MIYKNSKFWLVFLSAFRPKSSAVKVIVAIAALALAGLGCAKKPDLSVSSVRTMDFSAGAGMRRATPAEVERFVAAYKEAAICPNDMETTGGAQVVVTNTAGEVLWMRGGEEPYVNVYFGKDGLCTLHGKKLLDLFNELSQGVEPRHARGLRDDLEIPYRKSISRSR
ncbi:MAG TPA: hypothetical protein VFE51_28535 [Verrucomicrobiae bacterium]|nr:hypothetical protein [Verrucomicrobiae bacterium]